MTTTRGNNGPPQDAFKRLAEENTALNNSLKKLVEDKLTLITKLEETENARQKALQVIDFKDEEIFHIKKKLGRDRQFADEANFSKHSAMEEMEKLKNELERVQKENFELQLVVKKEQEAQSKAWEAVVIRDKQLQTVQREHLALLNRLGDSKKAIIVDPEGLALEGRKASEDGQLEETEEFKNLVAQDEANAMREAELSRLSKEKRLFLENVKLAEENMSLKHQVDMLQRADAKKQATVMESGQKLSQVEKNYKHVMMVLESEQKRRFDLSEEAEKLKIRIANLEKEVEFFQDKLNEATRLKLTTKMVAAESINEFSMRMRDALERVEQQEVTVAKSNDIIARMTIQVEELEKKLAVSMHESEEFKKQSEEADSEKQAYQRKLETATKNLNIETQLRKDKEKEILLLQDEIYRTREILRVEIEKSASLMSQSEEIEQLKRKNQQVVQIWRSEEAQLLRVKQEAQLAMDNARELEEKNAQLRKMIADQESTVVSAEETAQKAKKKSKTLKMELHEMNQKLTEATRTRAIAVARAKETEGREEEIRKKTVALEAKVQDFYRVTENAASVSEQNEKLRAEVAELRQYKEETQVIINNYKTALLESNKKANVMKADLDAAQLQARNDSEAKKRAMADLRAKHLEADDLSRLLNRAKDQLDDEEKARIAAQEEAALVNQRNDSLQAQIDLLDSKLQITEHLRSVDLEDAKVLESTMWAYSEEFQRKVKSVEESRINAHDEIKRLSALIRRLTAENFALIQRQKDEKENQLVSLEEMRRHQLEAKELRKEVKSIRAEYEALQKKVLKTEELAKEKQVAVSELRKERNILELRLQNQTVAFEKEKRLSKLKEPIRDEGKLLQTSMQGLSAHMTNVSLRGDEAQLKVEQRLAQHLKEQLHNEKYEVEQIRMDLRTKEEELQSMRRSLRLATVNAQIEAEKEKNSANQDAADPIASTETPQARKKHQTSNGSNGKPKERLSGFDAARLGSPEVRLKLLPALKSPQ